MGVFKNDVGRPTNETIKKRRILKAILALLVAGALFTGGYYVNEFINKYDVNKEKENSVSKKEAYELIGPFNVVSNNLEKFGYFYKEDRKVDNLDNDIILISAISELVTEDKYTFTKNEVNQNVKKIFGDIKYKDESVSSYCYEFNYDASKELYTDNSGCSGDGPRIYSEITNVENSYDKLIIINKIAVSDFNYDSGILTLYKDLNTSVIVKEDYDFNKGIKEYLNKLDSYKWSFIKNSEGNYIFESVEKIETEESETKNYNPKEAFDKIVKDNKLITYKDDEKHSDDDIPAFNMEQLKAINCTTATMARTDSSVGVYYIRIYEFIDNKSAKKEFERQNYAEKNPSGVPQDYKQNILAEKTTDKYELLELESNSDKTYEYYYGIRIDNYYITLYHADIYNELTEYVLNDVEQIKNQLNTMLDIK